MQPIVRLVRRTRRAFSLIELAVVLIVIGVIAAIAIPTFQGVILRAEMRTAEVSLAAMARAAWADVAFSELDGLDEDVVTATITSTPFQQATGTAVRAADRTTWDVSYEVDEPSEEYGVVSASVVDGVLSMAVAGPSQGCAYARFNGGAGSTWSNADAITADRDAAKASEGNPLLPNGGPGGPGSGGGGYGGGGGPTTTAPTTTTTIDPSWTLPPECGVPGTDIYAPVQVDVPAYTFNIENLNYGAYANGQTVDSTCLNADTSYTMLEPTYSIDYGATWLSEQGFLDALQADPVLGPLMASGGPYRVNPVAPVSGVPSGADVRSSSIEPEPTAAHFNSPAVAQVVSWGGAVFSVNFGMPINTGENRDSASPVEPWVRVPYTVSTNGGDSLVVHRVTFKSTYGGGLSAPTTRPWGVHAVNVSGTSTGNIATPLPANLGAPYNHGGFKQETNKSYKPDGSGDVDLAPNASMFFADSTRVKADPLRTYTYIDGATTKGSLAINNTTGDLSWSSIDCTDFQYAAPEIDRHLQTVTKSDDRGATAYINIDSQQCF